MLQIEHTEDADKTAKKTRGRPFSPGNNANPHGRPKGSRNALGEDFLKALHQDFTEHGVAAIVSMRTEKPTEYVKVIASILPKELTVKIDAYEEMADDELIDTIRTLESAVNAALGRVGPVESGTQAPGGHTEAGDLPALH